MSECALICMQLQDTLYMFLSERRQCYGSKITKNLKTDHRLLPMMILIIFLLSVRMILITSAIWTYFQTINVPGHVTFLVLAHQFLS